VVEANQRSTAPSSRVAGLGRRLAAAGLEGAVLLHDRDVFYYAGTLRPATLVVGRHDAALLVRRGLEPARREATVSRVEEAGGFSRLARVAGELGIGSGKLGIELDVVPVELADRLRGVFPGCVLTDVSPVVLGQRRVKDAAEVAAIRRAAAVADAGHRRVPEVLAPGITELEVAAEAEAAMRRAGHEAVVATRRPTAAGAGILVISGDNLGVRGGHGLVVTGAGLGPGMPYGPSRRVLRQGDLVVVDIGSMRDGYAGDEARSYVVGEAEPWQEGLFAVALAAQEALLEALRPGARGEDLYAAAEGAVARGAPPVWPPGSLRLPGFVGHGLGVEIDEPPVLAPGEASRIEEGTILAVELEVGAPSRGTMAKVEDTVVVRAGGVERLTGAARKLVTTHQG
jgi:Xaa-Pro dipeptidase